MAAMATVPSVVAAELAAIPLALSLFLSLSRSLARALPGVVKKEYTITVHTLSYQGTDQGTDRKKIF